MTNKTLSIVTVALNAADALPLTMESVVAQDYPGIEYILVDGLSHDGTQSLLDRYRGAFSKILLVEDAGIYQAMNQAASVATGDYILFLNAGDRIYSAHTISDMFSRIDGDPDIFYGDHIYVDGKVETLFRASGFANLRERLLHGALDHRWHPRLPGHQATFIRTRLLRAMPYDSRYTICADHEFLFRAYDAGARMQYIDEIVSHYYAGGFSSAQGMKLNREWALAYRSRSLRPSWVDAFLFGMNGSPFEPHHRYSGYIVAGASAPEIPHPEGDTQLKERRATIVEMITPYDFACPAISMVGENLLPGQILTFTSDDKVIGQKPLDVGRFGFKMTFSEPLLPGAMLKITPSYLTSLSLHHGQSTGFQLGAFHFDVAEPFGLEEVTLASDKQRFQSMLVSGWSGIEVDHGFTWSVDEHAYIAVRFTHAPAAISLYCSGNPHVSGEQWLKITLNDLDKGVYRLSPHSSTPIRIDTVGLRRTGSNIIRLSVDALAPPPRDARTLGFSLAGINFS
ncbi:glycosyltransferase family 2 protein [Sphingomonas sp. HH69]